MAFFTVIGITYSYLKNDQVITAINGALTGLAAFILLTPSSKVLDSGESVTEELFLKIGLLVKE